MSCKNLQPVYLTLERNLTVNHGKISVPSLFGLDCSSPHLFWFYRTYYAKILI